MADCVSTMYNYRNKIFLNLLIYWVELCCYMLLLSVCSVVSESQDKLIRLVHCIPLLHLKKAYLMFRAQASMVNLSPFWVIERGDRLEIALCYQDIKNRNFSILSSYNSMDWADAFLFIERWQIKVLESAWWTKKIIIVVLTMYPFIDQPSTDFIVEDVIMCCFYETPLPTPFGIYASCWYWCDWYCYLSYSHA